MIGDSPILNLVAALPNTGVLSMVGTAPGSLELTQIGAPGCRMHLDPIVMDLIFSNALGSASTSIYLPINPALIGQHLYVQDAIYDPGANQLGWNTSKGVDIKIGGWLGQ